MLLMSPVSEQHCCFCDSQIFSNYQISLEAVLYNIYVKLIIIIYREKEWNHVIVSAALNQNIVLLWEQFLIFKV